ncbi:MAG: YceI family protein [Candidatus Nitrotoga sp.]
MLKQNIIAVLLLASLPFAAHAADSYSIDPQHTFAHFSVSHLGFSTMHGRFDKNSGKMTLNRAAKSGSVDFTIEAASITTGFVKRDDHLRSPDFFSVVEFPNLTYKSSAIKFKGDTPISVEGNLTILGVTKPVTLTILSFKCGNHPMNKKELCGADASAQIKRSDFGMKFGLTNVGDDIKLVIEVEAYKD